MSSQNTTSSNGFFQLYKNSLWVKLCIWIFGGAMLLGIISQAYIAINEKTETPSISSKSLSIQAKPASESMSKSFSTDSSMTLEQWSPALVKLGFSFFVGLSIGFVLKTFFKISLFFSGIVFLILLGLSYFNIIEVKWEILESLYESMISNLDNQLTAFKDFVTGSLPSAGSFSLGLIAALKRR